MHGKLFAIITLRAVYDMHVTIMILSMITQLVKGEVGPRKVTADIKLIGRRHSGGGGTCIGSFHQLTCE